MKKEKIIAYYPYSCNTNAYHGLIQEMLSERFFVIDYYDVKKDIFQINDIDAIYFNWIEDKMDELDRALILKAHEAGVRTYWVFHNRVSHNRDMERECRTNIVFLMKNVSDIIILSRSSVKYLYEYVPRLDQNKLHYLPHPEYIGNYGALEDTAFQGDIDKSRFVFGCIGNLRPDKNIELIIEAFKCFPYRRESKLFIIGGPDGEDYLEMLENLIDSDENIILLPEHIPDYMMKFYVESADVLVLPYDVKTSMNSGVMLLAFTNKRTVIVSDICMTEEFDDALFYRYSYADEEDHIAQLTKQMERAYTDGKAAVRKKGEALFDEILIHNSKEKVKSELHKILGDLPTHSVRAEIRQMLSGEYRDKDMWRRKYTISDAWLQNVLSGNTFMEHLKYNQAKRIAIYGFGKYGKLLYKEMQKREIPVACIIDQNADKLAGDIGVCTLDDLHESLDIVIVTVAVDMGVIRERCQSFNEDCYVFSLGDI
jgi:glycosyltransferase involved in cell wall biosynthesis